MGRPTAAVAAWAHPVMRFVVDEAQRQHLTMREVCARAGYSQCDGWRWTSGTSRPSVVAAETLLNVLGYTLGAVKREHGR
jgi:transcriptional regulator with XRE-family HTH domain